MKTFRCPSFEFFAFSSYHDVNDGILVISNMGTWNLSHINLNRFSVAIHELSAWIQFHFELYLIVDFIVRHVLYCRLIKNYLKFFQLILG